MGVVDGGALMATDFCGIAFALLFCGVGCAATPYQSASREADRGKLLSERAEEVAAHICNDGYHAAARLSDAARPAAIGRMAIYCDPLTRALSDYEDAHKALTAALVAADLGVASSSALLADRRARLVIAGQALAGAIEGH